MTIGRPLDALSLWVIFLLTVVTLLVVNEGGYRISKVLNRKSIIKSSALGSEVVSAMLVLLAVLLSFLVIYAGEIYIERRQLVVKTANAIGTTYLRAGYLDEPYRSEARDMLREYTSIRFDMLNKTEIIL